jgi:alpha-beta hydrolase superfamily lysophospholipase
VEKNTIDVKGDDILPQMNRSKSVIGIPKSGVRKLNSIMAAAAVAACAFLSMPAECKEYQSALVDNLSQELGFPIYSWAPDNAPKAVVLAIHGATLHGRAYTTIGEHLSKNGYAVFSPDLRGFGAWYHNNKQDKEEERVTRAVLYRQSETDLKNLLGKLHELYPGKPVFIMGESVGANFAIKLLANNPDCAAGMILSSPAVKQRMFFGPTVMMQCLTVFFVNPGAQLDVTPYLKSRVSENKKITDERINDPLGRNKMNVGELFKTRWFNKECLTFVPQVPSKAAVLVIEGAEDKLFDAEDVNNVMSQMPCEDKTVHLMKGKGHINLETVYLQPDVASIVDDWLAEKSTKYANQPGKMTTVSSSDTGKTVP